MSRKGMKTGKKVFGVVAALAIGGFIFVGGLRDFRESSQLRADHKTAVGKVLDDRTAYRSKGRTKYYLTVEFQTDQNKSVTTEVLVNREAHRAGAASKTTTVHYLPSNPEICQAGDNVKLHWSNLLLGSLISICGVIGVLFFNRSETQEQPVDTLNKDADANLSSQSAEPRKAA